MVVVTFFCGGGGVSSWLMSCGERGEERGGDELGGIVRLCLCALASRMPMLRASGCLLLLRMVGCGLPGVLLGLGRRRLRGLLRWQWRVACLSFGQNIH